MSQLMQKLPVGVLISGGGTTLRNILELVGAGRLPIDVQCVISSRASAAGLVFAHQANVPTYVMTRRDFDSPELHSQSVFDVFRGASVGLVIMGGYLEHLLIPEDFANRVINIHPSLIPAFSGHGFYGLRVHEAVLHYGAKLSGCTVHFVDNQFDHGPIIAQRACPVLQDDTSETLQRRVFELECQLYPEMIAAIAEGRVQVANRRVSVRDA